MESCGVSKGSFVTVHVSAPVRLVSTEVLTQYGPAYCKFAATGEVADGYSYTAVNLDWRGDELKVAVENVVIEALKP